MNSICTRFFLKDSETFRERFVSAHGVTTSISKIKRRRRIFLGQIEKTHLDQTSRPAVTIEKTVSKSVFEPADNHRLDDRLPIILCVYVISTLLYTVQNGSITDEERRGKSHQAMVALSMSSVHTQLSPIHSCTTR